MTRRKWWNHSPEFKTEVAIATSRGDKTQVELVQQFDLHPNRIMDWEIQLLERSSQVFGNSGAKADSPDTTAMWLIALRHRGTPPCRCSTSATCFLQTPCGRQSD